MKDWVRTTSFIACLCSLSACSKESQHTAVPKVLIFSVGTGYGSPDGTNGPILGKMKSSVPPEPSALVVADQVLRCGGSSFSVEVSSHLERLILPSSPGDLALVRCVQDKVDFGFGAAIAPADNIDLADPDPFKALYAQKN